jgi:DNA-binding FadR family transcriptional regulator
MLERFGIGRSSLREALRILEVNGLVTLKPGPRADQSLPRMTRATSVR